MEKNGKGVLVLQAGICVIMTCILAYAALSIYTSGMEARQAGDALAWIYTPEAVAAWVPWVLPLFLISLAVSVYAWVKGIRDEEAEKPVVDTENTRNLVSGNKEMNDAIRQERRKQQLITAGGWAVFAGLLIPVLLYFTRESNFPADDLEGMFAAMAANCIPWMIGAAAALAVSFGMKEASMKKEIELSSQAAQRKTPGAFPEGRTVNARTASIDRITVLVLAIVFVILGIFTGGAHDVLVKAVNICTECVGLG